MQILFPKLDKQTPKGAIYKATFDSKWFYIGGSANIRSRFLSWRGTLQSGKIKNAQIEAIMHEEIIIRFEIVEWVKLPTEVPSAEDFHICQHWGNPLLLNVQATAFKTLIHLI